MATAGADSASGGLLGSITEEDGKLSPNHGCSIVSTGARNATRSLCRNIESTRENGKNVG